MIQGIKNSIRSIFKEPHFLFEMSDSISPFLPSAHAGLLYEVITIASCHDWHPAKIPLRDKRIKVVRLLFSRMYSVLLGKKTKTREARNVFPHRFTQPAARGWRSDLINVAVALIGSCVLWRHVTLECDAEILPGKRSPPEHRLPPFTHTSAISLFFPLFFPKPVMLTDWNWLEIGSAYWQSSTTIFFEQLCLICFLFFFFLLLAAPLSVSFLPPPD